MLSVLTQILAQRAGCLKGKRVLDIGCGTGETCSLWLEQGADVTGLDISPCLLEIAHKVTAGRVKLIEADATIWRSQKPFDLVVSRFGLMFFDDPGTAFSNIARNMQRGGELLFCCWRAVEENPWVTAPMAAIRDLLPAQDLSTRAPLRYAAGPFALAEYDLVRGLLQAAGLALRQVEHQEFPVIFSDQGIGAAVAFALELGPTASALADVKRPVRDKAAKRLKQLFEQHEQNGVVAFPGSSWIVTATRLGW
jgi:SAM-dependent methyltransferase